MEAHMAGYAGTDIQQRLQAQAEESAEFIAHTPGACQAGRTMGCDDPKQFGWDRIGEIVERDGVCGFRLVDTADVPEISSELFARGCRFDTWEVFLAERDAALLASCKIASEPLPSGLSLWTITDDPENQQIKDTQAMMASATRRHEPSPQRRVHPLIECQRHFGARPRRNFAWRQSCRFVSGRV